MTDSGHGFSEGGEFKKFTLLKENETTASDSTNFPFKVYDPTKEAKVLLEGYDSMTVVKGLLNQLQAARQTNDINAESYKFQINDQAKEIQQLKEALREIIPLAQNHASELLWDEDYSDDKVGGKEAQAIVDAAKTEGSEPIKLTDEQRIEKEAEAYADSFDRRGCTIWQGMYRGYKGGANAERQQMNTNTSLYSQEVIDSYEEQLKQRDETIKQLKEALKDLCEILPNADIWLGDADWKAIETARALIELNKPEK